MNDKQRAFLDMILGLKATMEKVQKAGNILEMSTWGYRSAIDRAQGADHPCGTAACIVGWHIIDSRPDTYADVSALANTYVHHIDIALYQASKRLSDASFIWASDAERRREVSARIATEMPEMEPIVVHPFNSDGTRYETPGYAVSYLQAIHDAFEAAWSK